MFDRIVKYEKGKSMTAVKNVSLSDFFIIDHHLHGVIMPHSFVIEAAAQVAGTLITASLDFKKVGLMSTLGSLKFNGVVRPGDQLRIEAELVSLQEEAGLATCRARVEREVVVEIEHCLYSLVDSYQFDDPEKRKHMFVSLLKNHEVSRNRY